MTLPFTAAWQRLVAWPKRYSIPLASVLVMSIVWVFLFMFETSVNYAYAGDTCATKLTLFPDTYQQQDSPFKLDYRHKVGVLGFNVAAGQSCFSLQSNQDPGQFTVATAMWGSWPEQQYRVSLLDPPEVTVNYLTKPISLTKAVVLGLSAKDQTFTYILRANDQRSDCQVVDMSVSCEIKPLGLEQGQSYMMTVDRYFDQELVEVVVEQSVEILSPTQVVDTSIKPDEVVMSKPTELVINFDKKIRLAKAELIKQGEQAESVAIKLVMDGQALKATFDELLRGADYIFNLTEFEADDGSSLAEPYSLPFKTSGGPRVAGISIGQSGVAVGSTAIIRFDQELSLSQDVAAQVSVSGGAAEIGRQGNTIAVHLSGIGKCSSFVIKVGNAIESIHGIGGNSAWSYTAKTACHSVETIGQSVQGRPIRAHVFGEGGTTILFLGAMHGNELSSSRIMHEWIGELEANIGDIPAGRKIVVIPEANPDGVAARTRNNARNVDLNRNYAMSNWRADVTSPSGALIKNGGGVQAMSEPETQALAAYTSRLRPRLTLSYHSIGGLVMGNGAGNSASQSQSYSRLSGYRDVTGQIESTFSYEITGAYEDWMAEKLGLPNLVIELGSHTNSQFSRNRSAMWAMVRD